MPLGIQPIHIVIIIAVAFLIFGSNKLPEMGRGAGKAISEFRKGAREMTNGFREEVRQTGSTQTVSTPDAPTVPQTFQAASNLRLCIHCGAPNPAEARFCAACGTKLPEKAA